MNSDVQEDFRKRLGRLIVMSIVLIVLGILSIIMPAISSVTFTLVLALILLAGGIIRVIKSFHSHPVRGFWLNLVTGVLYAIAGLVILVNPLAGTLSLTAIVGTLFMGEGIFTIIMAFQVRPGGQESWMMVLDGVITLIMGILVWNQFPSSALWLIGLYVGISLLMSGISLLVITLAARRSLDLT